MEHRKRHAMQHKVELTTLLKLMVSTMKKKHAQKRASNTQNISRTLANEALKILKESDRQMVLEVENETCC